MAANQAYPEAVLNSKVEAALKELSKKGEKSSQVSIQTEAVTHGNLVNATVTDLYVVAMHNWSGKLTVPYPPVFRPTEQDPATFEHRGLLPGGSKGGVVYTDGTNNPTGRKWIVAFDRVHNKVYIETGPTGQPVDWNVVEAKFVDVAPKY